FLTEKIFGGLLHLLKDHRRNLLRRIKPSVDIDPGRIIIALGDFIGNALDLFLDLVIAVSHKTLDRENCPLRIGDRLALGRIAYFPFAAFYKGYDRRSGPLAFTV